jgi:hypothetical protein
LKTNDPQRTDVEKAMDEFFMTHLPEQVIKTARDYQNNELNEDAVRRVMRSEVPNKKNRSQGELSNDPHAFNRNRILPIDKPTRKKTKQKSDFTLAFMDSSQQVAKLAFRSEIGQKIQKMRTVAKSQYRVSPPLSSCQSQGLNGETEMPSPNRTAYLTPSMFKRRYSQQLSTDLSMIRRVESIVAERQPNHKSSTEKEDSSPNLKRVDTVREEDMEDSAPSHTDSTVKENATDSLDPVKSDRVQKDAIGELDDSPDAGRENSPAD